MNDAMSMRLQANKQARSKGDITCRGWDPRLAQSQLESSKVSGHTPLIPPLRRQNQAELEFEASLVLQGDFQDSQDCI